MVVLGVLRITPSLQHSCHFSNTAHIKYLLFWEVEEQQTGASRSTVPRLASYRIQLHPDVRSAISSWIAHLVGARGASRLFAKINVELLVERESAVHRVALHLQDVAPRFCHPPIALVIPATHY